MIMIRNYVLKSYINLANEKINSFKLWNIQIIFIPWLALEWGFPLPTTSKSSFLPFLTHVILEKFLHLFCSWFCSLARTFLNFNRLLYNLSRINSLFGSLHCFCSTICNINKRNSTFLFIVFLSTLVKLIVKNTLLNMKLLTLTNTTSKFTEKNIRRGHLLGRDVQLHTAKMLFTKKFATQISEKSLSMILYLSKTN